MSEHDDQPPTEAPTATLEDLRIGAPARGSDGHTLGELQRIVVSETTHQVTHLVIDPGLLASGNALAPGGWEKPRARVVPIALLTNATTQEITLDCDEAAFNASPLFEKERASAANAPDAPDRAHWWSRANLGEVITYLFSEISGPYIPNTPDEEITLNEPTGAAAISAGAAVWRRDADTAPDAARHGPPDETEVGVVEHALLESDGRLSALVIRRKGTLGAWGELVILPADQITDLDDDIVHITLTNEEIEALAPFKEE